MVGIWVALAVLQVPLFEELLLAHLTTCKVVGIHRLLKWMPVVEDPVGWQNFSLEGDSTGGVCEFSWLWMLLVEQFLLASTDDIFNNTEVADLAVLIEAGTHHNSLVAVVRSKIFEGLF